MPPVKVSVIVPTYCSGPTLDAVLRCLEAQTLATEEFEVVFVDDGSPDDTYDRLLSFARDRTWVRVEQIVHSGWPGRPRNVGVRSAAGRYVFFMDDDDYLFPDALRRMFDFAEANDLDVVHAKEVVDGWSSPAWRCFRTQIGKGFDADTFDSVTPHKLYRRSFLIDQDVWFREGPVRLEDIDFNVRAWMRTDAIGVMADYPAYTWIIHPDGIHRLGSSTYWDDLRIAVQPLADDCASDPKRYFVWARIYRRQILDRLRPSLLAASEEDRAALAAALRDQLPHFPGELDAYLDPPRRARSALLRREDWAGLLELAQADLGLTLVGTKVRYDWVDGQLDFGVEGFIGAAAGDPMAVRRVGDRIVRDLPGALADRFREGELDLTDDLAAAHVELVVRSRRDKVDWTIPSLTSEVWVQPVAEDLGQVHYRVRGRIDPATAAFGAALDQDRYEIFHRILGLGYTRVHRVRMPQDVDTTSLLRGLPMRLTVSGAGFAVIDPGAVAAVVAREVRAATPVQLAVSRETASLDAPVELPADGTWSRKGVLEVVLFGLYKERWRATLRSQGGHVSLRAHGPTPPPGLHRCVLRMGGNSAKIGWLSHEQAEGQPPILVLLDATAARERAQVIAHDSRLPPAATARSRALRAFRRDSSA